MDNARGGRHDAEVIERLLAPLEELVAFAVALELALGVVEQRKDAAKAVHLHAVIDHQIDRHQRVDLLGVAAQPRHRAAQRRQVHHAGHAGEVLQDRRAPA